MDMASRQAVALVGGAAAMLLIGRYGRGLADSAR